MISIRAIMLSCLQYLENLKANLLLDIHLYDHVETLYSHIRHKILIQYTHPFVSVDLNMMADAFKTSVGGLEKELEAFSLTTRFSLTSSGTIASGSRKLESSAQNLVWKPDSKLIDGLFVPPNDPRKLNKLIRKQQKDTTGSNWFDILAPTITPEIKKDLQILKVGTVIESASDFFSGRLTKKERKETLANELLADHSLTKYRKRKIREIEEQKRPAEVEMWINKGRQSWKRAKDRRHY